MRVSANISRGFQTLKEVALRAFNSTGGWRADRLYISYEPRAQGAGSRS